MTWLPPQDAPESVPWTSPQPPPSETVPWTAPAAASHEPSALRRLGALLIDVVTSVASFVSLFIASAFMAGLVGTSDDFDDAFLLPATLIAGLLVMLLLPVVLMCRGGAANGQSLGKQALGLRVVREDGRPVGFGTALLREVGGKVLLPLTILWLVIDVAFLLGGRSLHDRLASTLVAPAHPAGS